jgi:tRNA 2-thiouridine synthesizing protein A
MPVIRTQDRVKSLDEGDILTVWCTDPGASSDIPAWCRVNGHEVVEIKEQQGELAIIIKVGPKD